jgi:hypothetical protein
MNWRDWADPDILDAQPIPNPKGEAPWQWAVTRLLDDGSTLTAIEDRAPETWMMHQDRLLAEVEAKRRAPLDAKARTMALKIARASELHTQGKSPAQIAQIMTSQGLIRAKDLEDARRIVNRWLKEAK